MGIRSQVLPRLARGAYVAMAGLLLLGAWRPAASVCAPLPTDSLARALPGSLTGASLLRGLRTPSSEKRWNSLPVFGRALFTNGTFLSPVEGAPVGPGYVLGPGDQLQVFVSSFADTNYTLTLDREGKVFVPRVGSTYLWNQSFAEAEQFLRSRLATVYRTARIQVSMGRMRAVEVFVLGDAVRPGKVTLTGNVSVFHALAAAGGPSPLGSMRDLRVMRGDREVSRGDLYPFLLSGDRRSDPRIENGDVLFVAQAGGRVGIQGEVARPAVYEMRGRMSLHDLLALCGGATPFADLSRVRIDRVEANGGFHSEDVLLGGSDSGVADTLMLKDQDLVTVLALTERTQNEVTLDGYVRHPGGYELTKGMRLSQLLTRERMLPEADLEHAEFRRVDPATFKVDVRSFSPRALWAGENDWVLQPLDAVTVFSSARLPAAVSLAGEVTRPGTYSITPGERLSAVLARAGGVTKEGSIRAAVFRRPGSASYVREMRRALHLRRDADLEVQRQAVAGDSAALAAIDAQKRLFDQLESGLDDDRVVLALDERQKWVGTARDVVLEDGDQLYVPLHPTTVLVLGNVMNPGTLSARRGATPGDYIRMAGGLSRRADRSSSYVLRAGGEAVPLARVSRVEPGDAIVIAPQPVESRTLGRNLASATQYLVQAAAAAAVIMAAGRR